MNDLFGGETPDLQEIRKTLRNDEKEGINVGPSEGAILKTLVAMSQAKTIVEVGTLYGYSALWMAQALPEDGHIYCIEKSDENFAKASELIGKSEYASKITLIHGDAEEALEALSAKGPFDIVFIDANKGGYKRYLDWAVENVPPGGCIIGDNTFLFGNVYGEGRSDIKVGPNPIAAMNSFNEYLAHSEDFVSCMLPTGEGMTVGVRK